MMVWLLRTFVIESVRRRDQQRTRVELIIRPDKGLPIRLKIRQH